MTLRADTPYLIAIAMSGAAMTMAYQVAGKAARDALFLSNFRSHHLPAMIVGGAIAAILLGLLNSRVLTSIAPARIIPGLMIFSGALQAVEWITYGPFPRPTSVAIYLHVISLGAVITSGFWSVIGEQLDPYTAKHTFGRIAAAGTVGGVLGGAAAERIAAWTNSHGVLLFMAAVQIGAGVLLYFLPRATALPQPRTRLRARDVLSRSSYLRNLSYLVVLGTFSAALLDYVLKSQARFTLGAGEPLMRFFAMFHTSTALLAFLVQTAGTQYFLNRWGVGTTVATLPAGVAGGGLLALLTGAFPFIVLVRGIEAVIRGSLFRAAYELFYTPMLPAEKRAVKSINDVTIDRLGDGFGGGFVQVVLLYGGNAGTTIMLATAATASAAACFLAARLHGAYVKSIERSLTHRARHLEISEDEDGHLSSETIASGQDTQAFPSKYPVVAAVPEWLPAEARQQWDNLRSGDRERIKSALTSGPLLHRALLPHVIPLLARRSVTEAVTRALVAVAPINPGQLADHLLDPSVPLAVRAKLPAILAVAGPERATDALLRGLCDKETEIRVQCGHALDAMRQNDGVEVDPERVYSAIRYELDGHTNPNLAYLFSLLGVVLPRRPVRVAFEALENDDPQLRGLAFEYLETALPPDVSAPLLETIQGASEPAPQSQRPTDIIREEFVSLLQQIRRPGADDHAVR